MTTQSISNFTAQEIQTVAQQQKPVASLRVRRLFAVLHASYGSLFTAKFSTGELNADGTDKGIRAALLYWDRSLSNYEDDIVEKAIHQVQFNNPNYPPNLPHILKECEILKSQKERDKNAVKNAQVIKLITQSPPKIKPKHDGLDNFRQKLARFFLGHNLRKDDVKWAIKMLGEKETLALKKEFSKS